MVLKWSWAAPLAWCFAGVVIGIAASGNVRAETDSYEVYSELVYNFNQRLQTNEENIEYLLQEINEIRETQSQRDQQIANILARLVERQDDAGTHANGLEIRIEALENPPVVDY